MWRPDSIDRFSFVARVRMLSGLRVSEFLPSLRCAVGDLLQRPRRAVLLSLFTFSLFCLPFGLVLGENEWPQ
ncbi:MAG: hypothetical protein KDA91_14000, partial [Planctomycetaceae bacterium]|nr:hypothetical protein [Planctomycetaceae bacterium]